MGQTYSKVTTVSDVLKDSIHEMPYDLIPCITDYLPKGKLRAQLYFSGKEYIESMVVGPDGTLFVRYDDNICIHAYDINSKEKFVVASHVPLKGSRMACTKIQPDGSYLIVNYGLYNLLIIDNAGNVINSFSVNYPVATCFDAVYGIAIRDDNLICAVTDSGNILTYEMNGKLVNQFKVTGSDHQIFFGSNGNIYVYSTETTRPIYRKLIYHIRTLKEYKINGEFVKELALGKLIYDGSRILGYQDDKLHVFHKPTAEIKIYDMKSQDVQSVHKLKVDNRDFKPLIQDLIADSICSSYVFWRGNNILIFDPVI